VKGGVNWLLKFKKVRARRAGTFVVPAIVLQPLLPRIYATDPNGVTIGALLSSRYRVVPTIALSGYAHTSGPIIYGVPEQSGVVKYGPLPFPVRQHLSTPRVKNVPFKT
jgi:hypothetical protein